MSIKNSTRSDRIAVISLSLSVLLGIFAFIPGGFIPENVLKGYVLIVGVLVSFSAWLIGRLLEGKFRITWSPVVGAAFVMFVVFFLSALFSKTSALSFMGEAFDQTTFVILGVLCLALFLASILFVQRKRVLGVITAFFLVYLVIALYQLIHLFFPAATALGVFGSTVSTPMGLWSDFGFFSGAALLGFVMLFEFLPLSGLMRVVSIIGSILALFFVILTNVFLVWVLVGVGALFVLVYKLVIARMSETRVFPKFAFILALIALFFIPANALFGGVLASKLNTVFVSVNPSFGATAEVARHSIAAHPIFGAGPNRFAHEWAAYKPATVNGNTLWDVQFSLGVSFFATIAILGGALGLIAVLLFLIAYGYESVRKAILSSTDPASSVFVFSVFVISLYFMAALLFFSPGISVTLTAFFFVGIFLAALRSSGRIPEKTMGFLKDQRTSFFGILLVVALFIVSIGLVYGATERLASIVYYNMGIRAAAAGDIVKADRRMAQAIALTDLPSYERARVSLAVQALRQTLNNATENTSKDALRASIQQTVTIADQSARRAIALDPKNPENYMVLGDLMRTLTPLKIEGAFDAAKDAYARAISEAPESPKAYLALAELYFQSKDYAAAQVHIDEALQRKPNYTAAFFLMAQIQIAQGSTSGAIKKLEEATVVDPNNPETYFQLGLLRLDAKNYESAAFAFRAAVSLDTSNVNVWYFLAVADSYLGTEEREEARVVLEALVERFPENTDIADALARINRGESINIQSSGQSADEAPQLPVPETDTKTN